MTGAELVMLLQRYQAAVVGCTLACGVEDSTRTATEAEQLRRQILQAFNAEVSHTQRLALAGDRLAHDLMYAQHRDALEAWWAARGGHVRNCTVCNPEAPAPVVTVITTDNAPILCGCAASDAWQCARATGNSMFVTCQCVCHQPARPRRAA